MTRAGIQVDLRRNSNAFVGLHECSVGGIGNTENCLRHGQSVVPPVVSGFTVQSFGPKSWFESRQLFFSASSVKVVGEDRLYVT